ncbi:MAG: hypothetical protein JWM04_1081 [Verrucomicrobiales bacterium]|nr:hypothetical protein [Verrucomicrobiales bacterium]
MKLKSFIVAGALALAIAQVTSLAIAKNVEKIQSFKKILAKVAVAERPAKVAALVASALPADKKETMESLVEAVAELNPTALSAVVGAIAKTTPELASAASTFAATLVPSQADYFKLATQTSSLTSYGAASKGTESISLLATIAPRPGGQYVTNPITHVVTYETNSVNSTPPAGSNYNAP